MEENKNIFNPESENEEVKFDLALRPQSFEEYVGQKKQIDNLKIFIRAAKERREPMEHILLCGPPGLGKTTLAYLIAKELGVILRRETGPGIEIKGQLVALLTSIQAKDVLFIDEIHRLPITIEEMLYPALEDFEIDIIHGEGPHAMVIKLPLPPFTLIGATTREGLLSKPLLSRFGIIIRLDFYSPQELLEIIQRGARILNVKLKADAGLELAKRSRGTPRIANRLLRRARDFAQIIGNGIIDINIVHETLNRLEIDNLGLDKSQRQLMIVIIDDYKGGPVGIDTLSVSISESKDTIEDVLEPFLIQQGLIKRTSRGRVVTQKGYLHLGVPFKDIQYDQAELGIKIK